MRNIRNYITDSEFKIIIKKDNIYIENYIDVGNIYEKEIIIFTKNNKIKILGNNLYIKKMLNKQILILGKYTNISFEDIDE